MQNLQLSLLQLTFFVYLYKEFYNVFFKYYKISSQSTFVYCVVQTRWIVPEAEMEDLGR